jgi:hypothetical protein
MTATLLVSSRLDVIYITKPYLTAIYARPSFFIAKALLQIRVAIIGRDLFNLHRVRPCQI